MVLEHLNQVLRAFICVLSCLGKHLFDVLILTLIGVVGQFVCGRLMRADNFADAVQFGLAVTRHEITPFISIIFTAIILFTNTGKIIRLNGFLIEHMQAGQSGHLFDSPD